jgi:hypothetical protein
MDQTHSLVDSTGCSSEALALFGLFVIGHSGMRAGEFIVNYGWTHESALDLSEPRRAEHADVAFGPSMCGSGNSKGPS